MTGLVVHTSVTTPFGRSVLALLEEKGIAYSLDLIEPRNFGSATHLAAHPFGRVPWIDHDGFTLYETQAILRYLEELPQGLRLIPSDAQSRARMGQILNMVDWYLFQGVIAIVGYQRVVRPLWLNQETDEAAVEATLPLARSVLSELAAFLGARDWLAGDALSLADLAAAAHLAILSTQPEWGGLIGTHSALERWFDGMMARPALLATTPDRLAACAAVQSAA